MEDLAPPLLSAVREIKWRLASGRSMREAVRLYLDGDHSTFALELGEWWALANQTPGRGDYGRHFQSPLRKGFLHLIERGCAGQPTLEHLTALEDEIEGAAELELQSHLSQLPFKVLLPLLFFQFPAYLILLLGPVLRNLAHQLGS